MTRPVIVSARKVGFDQAVRDDFTYAVLRDPVTANGERRSAVRRRTRLRSGKALDADGRFLVECLIANRSAQGGLLRLPGSMSLPGHFLLYDDQSGEIIPAMVVWRRDRQIGIRFGAAERTARLQALAASMRRKFYAVGN